MKVILPGAFVSRAFSYQSLYYESMLFIKVSEGFVQAVGGYIIVVSSSVGHLEGQLEPGCNFIKCALGNVDQTHLRS